MLVPVPVAVPVQVPVPRAIKRSGFYLRSCLAFSLVVFVVLIVWFLIFAQESITTDLTAHADSVISAWSERRANINNSSTKNNNKSLNTLV